MYQAYAFISFALILDNTAKYVMKIPLKTLMVLNKVYEKACQVIFI